MTWNDITIRQFTEINEVLKTGDIDNVETMVDLCCICTGKSKEYYMGLPKNELLAELEILNGLNDRKEVDARNKYMIAGREYVLTMDFDKMNAGQYIDYTNLIQEQPDNRALIMATLLVPKGKKYGEDYKISDLADTLYNHMKWVDVEAICFFFQVFLKSYTKAKLSSLLKRLRREWRKEKDPGKAAIIQQGIDQVQESIAGLG